MDTVTNVSMLKVKLSYTACNSYRTAFDYIATINGEEFAFKAYKDSRKSSVWRIWCPLLHDGWIYDLRTLDGIRTQLLYLYQVKKYKENDPWRKLSVASDKLKQSIKTEMKRYLKYFGLLGLAHITYNLLINKITMTNKQFSVVLVIAALIGAQVATSIQRYHFYKKQDEMLKQAAHIRDSLRIDSAKNSFDQRVKPLPGGDIQRVLPTAD